MSKHEMNIPDIDKLKETMLSHIENGREEEAWALSEHWTMEYKRNSWWKPKTLKKREIKKQREEKLHEIKSALKNMYAEYEAVHVPHSYEERMKKAVEEKKEISTTYGDPWLYLEFVESKLKQYGVDLEAASNKTSPSGLNEKELVMTAMSRMIYDMHLYFDVWSYEDMYSIKDEKMRLKIAELARLYLSYKGIDAAAPPQPDNTYGVHEKSLASLL